MRLQPAGLGGASSATDNASPANIAALVALGTATARQFDAELERIAAVLVENGPDPVEFGKLIAAQ